METTPECAARVSRDPGSAEVAIVTMDSPDGRHAFGLALRQQLHAALDRLMFQDASCRAIVLAGAGTAFCAGTDMSEMTRRPVLEGRAGATLATGIFELVATGPKPVVAAVEGAAFGPGLALAAAADIVVASTQARFCADSVRMGLLPQAGLHWSLPRRVGGGRARELMLTVRELGGDEAAAIGLADRVVQPGQALAAACAEARRFLAIPPLAQAHMRSALAYAASTLDATLEAEAHFQPLLRRSEDNREAVAAFLEKRKPVFTGN